MKHLCNYHLDRELDNFISPDRTPDTNLILALRGNHGLDFCVLPLA